MKTSDEDGTSSLCTEHSTTGPPRAVERRKPPAQVRPDAAVRSAFYENVTRGWSSFPLLRFFLDIDAILIVSRPKPWPARRRPCLRQAPHLRFTSLGLAPRRTRMHFQSRTRRRRSQPTTAHLAILNRASTGDARRAALQLRPSICRGWASRRAIPSARRPRARPRLRLAECASCGAILPRLCSARTRCSAARNRSSSASRSRGRRRRASPPPRRLRSPLRSRATLLAAPAAQARLRATRARARATTATAARGRRSRPSASRPRPPPMTSRPSQLRPGRRSPPSPPLRPSRA